MIKYLSQGRDTTCFPVALVNCGLYCDIELDLQHYIKMGCCESGSVIGAHNLVLDSGLPLEETSDFDLVCDKGGIVSIMHPIFNLHAVFIRPTNNPELVFGVNSWLAPNEFEFSKDVLRKFLPSKPNNRHYYLKS